jgi:DNA-binding GntR family transcriptional regulator
MKLMQRERAYIYIRGRLADGSLAAGARLSPASLAREINVSPVPVREALSQLKSEGMVVHDPHRGAFVRDVDRQELVEMIEVRSMIECHSAAKAALRINDEQLRELERCWANLQKLSRAFRVPPTTDLREPLGKWHLGDQAFHNVLLAAAGNRHAIRFMDLARVMTHVFGYRTDHPAAWADPTAFGEQSLRIHEPIYEAVRKRDPRAARRAMVDHMRVSRRNILLRFDWLRRQKELEESQVEEFPESLRNLITDIQHTTVAELPVKRPMPRKKNGTK